MSTIASPRDRPPPSNRQPSSTPTSPPPARDSSIDPFSPTGTPSAPGPASPLNPNTAGADPAPGGTPRRSNRAALREYYKLRSTPSTGQPPPPRIEASDSEVPYGEMDAPDFDADAFVKKVLATYGLADLLRFYTQVLAEIRALDAEKKALVYDNYSKLIAATDTIRKMRANMDPLKPLASTLDPAIAQIYSQASEIREATRETVPDPNSEEGKARAALARRRKTQQLAAEVVATPQILRDLVAEGKIEEAKEEWDLPRKLLLSWKEKGIGGDDVQACIDEGDAVFASAATSALRAANT